MIEAALLAVVIFIIVLISIIFGYYLGSIRNRQTQTRLED